MKYILDKKELDDFKKEHEFNGYKKAESLLLEILNGQRNLFINQPEHPEPQNLYCGSFNENPWKMLIDRLDKKDAK